MSDFGSKRVVRRRLLQAGSACWRSWVLLPAPATCPLRRSAGCVSCHGVTDSPSMHTTGTVQLGCMDCHGGKPVSSSLPARQDIRVPTGQEAGASATEHRRLWKDLGQSCPRVCQMAEGRQGVHRVRQPGRPAGGRRRPAAMSCETSARRADQHDDPRRNAVEAALYNNGGFPYKDARFRRELLARRQAAAASRITRRRPGTDAHKGVLPQLEPLGRWEVSQPGNILRVFERGGGPRRRDRQSESRRRTRRAG